MSAESDAVNKSTLVSVGVVIVIVGAVWVLAQQQAETQASIDANRTEMRHGFERVNSRIETAALDHVHRTEIVLWIERFKNANTNLAVPEID